MLRESAAHAKSISPKLLQSSHWKSFDDPKC